MSCKLVPLVAVMGTLLSIAGIASAAITHYWSFDLPDDDVNGHPTDLIGGYTAYQTGPLVTTPPTRTNAADGVTNGAVSVAGTVNSSASGYQTSLAALSGGAGRPFSFEAMFRWTGSGYNWSYLTDRNNASVTCPITLARYKSGVLCVWIGATSVWYLADGPAWNCQDGQWYDIALTYDGFTANLYLTPYSPAATPILAVSKNLESLNAGGARGMGFGGCDNSKYGITGFYDWAAVWDKALTAEQIQRHIQNNSPLVDVPEITNANGATNIQARSAFINGFLTATGGAPTDVWVYWGENDGQDTNTCWANTNYLGIFPAGVISTNFDGLLVGTTYYYRYWASNTYGTAWASPSTNFTTLGTIPRGTIITVR